MFTEKEFRSHIDNYVQNRVIPQQTWVSKEEIMDRGIVLYGCAVMGKYVCDALQEAGIYPAYFVDKKSGTEASYHGVPIRGLESLSETNGRYVLLCSTHIQQMIQTCQQYGVSDWILAAAIRDLVWLPGDFGITSQLDHVPQGLAEGFHLFADDKSRRIYDLYFGWHYLYNNDFTAVRDPIMYFPEDLSEEGIDYSHFCDAGAWHGDVLAEWLAKFADKQDYHYTAIEPDKISYQKLVDYVNKLPVNEFLLPKRISTINGAVGEKSGIIKMSNDTGAGTTRVLGNEVTGAVAVPVFTIDEIFKDKAVSIIKADVEGYEMPLLRGALKTIKKQRPTLAISVYHKFADIWEIPQYVKSLDLDYEIYLRHFPNVFTDTVMFAIAK
ncbi:MAG: FkbM family methyltransferase [Clostridiales bacterium]|nr:FkbM family methyltransferase [Clostridiales bacterium]